MKMHIFTLFLSFLVSQALFEHIGLLPVSFQFLLCQDVQALGLTAPTSALYRFHTQTLLPCTFSTWSLFCGDHTSVWFMLLWRSAPTFQMDQFCWLLFWPNESIEEMIGREKSMGVSRGCCSTLWSGLIIMGEIRNCVGPKMNLLTIWCQVLTSPDTLIFYLFVCLFTQVDTFEV